ncbi:hypothetical protein [Streptomyces sp. NPDC006552]|uniref:hypothetical protein n=1 Tax=Streptomyces sp. NPDC006552 TaxID=3157179 RepID=UPI0033A66E55
MFHQGADRNPHEHVLAADLAQTAAALRQQFPKLTIDGNLSGADDLFWTTRVRRGTAPLSVVDLLTTLLGFLGTEQRVGIDVRFVSEGIVAEGLPGAGQSKGIRLMIGGKVPLSASDKLKRPFSLNQVYRPGATGLELYLEAVVAPQHGRQYTQLLLSHAQDLGVTRFALLASMIGGSQEGVFAWARYGFVPLQESWDDMRRSGLAVLAGDPEELRAHNAELRDILLDPAPKALRRLVHRSWQWQGATVDFLNRVLVAHVNWQAELDLADQPGCRWLRTYAQLTKASDHLDQFTPLLPAPSAHLVPPPALVAEPVAADDSEEDGNPFGLDEDTEVSLLVANIESGDATFEEIEEEYGPKRPDVVAKVRAALHK